MRRSSGCSARATPPARWGATRSCARRFANWSSPATSAACAAVSRRSTSARKSSASSATSRTSANEFREPPLGYTSGRPMTPPRKTDDRAVELEELTMQPGTYFNPQTEVLIVVDDSTSLDQEVFNMEDYEGVEWVRIAEEVPVDEDRRDALLER